MGDRYRRTFDEGPLSTTTIEDVEGKSRVEIAPARGGMVTRFTVDGEEVLFMDDSTLRDPSKNVRGGVPILFPVAGKLANDTLVLPEGPRPMKQHGFARNRSWSARVDPARPNAVVCEMAELADDAKVMETAWHVAFTYVLDGARLRIEQSYAHSNAGGPARRIQPGLHPYFYVPDDKKKDARVLTDATRGRDNTNGAPVTIEGPIDLTKKEVDLHLLDPKKRPTTLVRPGMRDVVVETSSDFTVTVVWTLAGRDFVCVEPWMAPANALNEGGGVEVNAGERYETWVAIVAG